MHICLCIVDNYHEREVLQFELIEIPLLLLKLQVSQLKTLSKSICENKPQLPHYPALKNLPPREKFTTVIKRDFRRYFPSKVSNFSASHADINVKF